MAKHAASKPADNRSAAQIKADLAATRARMSANVRGLVTEVHPTAVKQRATDDAKQVAAAEFAHVKSQVKDEDGWRTDRLTLAGAAAGAVVVGLLVVRGIVRGIGKAVTKKSKKRR